MFFHRKSVYKHPSTNPLKFKKLLELQEKSLETLEMLYIEAFFFMTLLELKCCQKVVLLHREREGQVCRGVTK